MIFVVGEVLFDIFPDDYRIGGAPFNFAFHLKQMGFPVHFITRIGMDDSGKEILSLMKQYKFDTNDIQIDQGHETGTVMVTLNKKGTPKFTIGEDVAYDYIEFSPDMERKLNIPPSLVYFGSLIQRSKKGHQLMKSIFSSGDARTVFFYDVNFRPGCYNTEAVQSSLPHTDILKLNTEELNVLSDLLNIGGDTISIVHHLIEIYHLSAVALTKGEQGSEIFTPSEHHTIKIPGRYRQIDTVGAGDAFAAVLAAGYLRHLALKDILKAATDFSARICTVRGAIPKDPNDHDFYKGVNRLIHRN